MCPEPSPLLFAGALLVGLAVFFCGAAFALVATKTNQ